jgi:hypothetical protein
MNSEYYYLNMIITLGNYSSTIFKRVMFVYNYHILSTNAAGNKNFPYRFYGITTESYGGIELCTVHCREEGW